MIKELLLISSLAFSPVVVETKSSISTLSATWDYVNEIEDGAVYFIRSSLLDSKVWNIANADYANGKNVNIYSSLGWGYQRFVLKKDSSINGNTSYNIIPSEDYNKVLSIKSDDSSENSPLIIKSNSSFSSNLSAHKFVLVPGSSTNSFRILTGESGFTKYLTLDSYSVADNTNIVQKTYDSNYDKCFDWYLQKTDSLGTNLMHKIPVDGTNVFTYNVRVPVSGNYIIETSKFDEELDTKIFLYKDDGTTLLSSDDDGGTNRFSRIKYNLSSKQDYWVRTTGYDASQIGQVNLSLIAENTVYINTYCAPNDIDTRKDSVSPQSDLSSAGYYVKHLVNAIKTDMLTIDDNGLNRLNNPYYMLSSHGSESGAALLAPGQYLYGRHLPNMANVKLAVWAICYGGKEGNIAQYCANSRNAQYSLGFPGLTYTNTSKTFTDKLWKEISNGKSVTEAVNLALNHTKSTHWFTHMFGWGDDTIVSPVLYSSLTNTQSTNDVSLDIPSSQKNMLPIFSKLLQSNKSSLETFVNGNNTKFYDFNDSSLIVKFENAKPTNDYFVVSKIDGKIYSHIKSTENNITTANINYKVNKFTANSSKTITLENDFSLFINGNHRNIRRTQFILNDNEFKTLNEVYYDIDTFEIFDEQQILDAFLK